MKTDVEIINEIFKNNGIYYDVYSYGITGVTTVEIEWGDWKHDHGYAKWLLEQNGYVELGSEVTEEDGSDCYSAKHYFCEKDNPIVKMKNLFS